MKIRRNNEYISVKNDEYVLTTNENEAKVFTWIDFLFGKKIVLEGIYNLFGIGFEIIK